MLKFTDVNLKLTSDIRKCQFIESPTRGGIYMIFKGSDEGNDKFLKSYNASKPTANIIYLDANNLMNTL